MIRRGMAATALAALAALAGLAGFGATRAGAQASVIRGLVTDTAGRPLAGVEVLSITFQLTARTGADGRYALPNVRAGEQLLMARLPGYRAAERVVTLVKDATPPTVDFALERLGQALDTVRVTAVDACPPYAFAGFECRRRLGVGNFRGEAELAATRAVFMAHLLYGMPGLRMEAVRLGLSTRATTGWRCLAYGWNGREMTNAQMNIRPQDIHAVEHYETYEEVPEPYKRLAWPRQRAKPCALVMYWTRDYVAWEQRQAEARTPHRR